MIAASLFSGIGAPEVAMPSWRWPWYAEIEKFPAAVMRARHPHSVNLGDVTADDFAKRAQAIASPDVLVFGSPCQSFSVAGKRLGLDDPRGNLAIVALKVVGALRPRWFVFENVPGLLSSDEGRDFGAFLGIVGQLGYGFAYRVLDAQFFGVPQRRRRVFVVGHLGDWRCAAAVLFEPESLRGDSAPSRQAREDVAPTIASRPTGGGGLGTDFDCDGALIAFGGNNTAGTIDVATAVNAHGGPHGRLDFESETFVTHPLRGDSFDAGDDGTGRGTPLVTAIAFQSRIARNGRGQPSDVVPALNGADAGATSDMRPLVALSFGENIRGEVLENEIVRALQQQGGKPGQGYAAARIGSAVRRLTPRECERLQGFPNDYTLITYRGKPAADGPRYKTLGNSMAVPVMRWILTRIEQCEALAIEARAA